VCPQAILESLEAQLPQQLPGVPSDLLASGLWAMARLQLQPQQELIATVAEHLLQPDRQLAQAFCQQDSSSNNAFVAAACRTRLAGCSARSFGTFCYSLNFFLLRNAHFWSVAAAVALQHLAQLKPANISNLLQGLALSGWVLDAGALGPQQVSSSRLGVDTQQGVAADGDAADAVCALLTALEASLLAAPWQLRLWRLRDISQLAQSCALIGFRCGPLFAVIAQHLLEYSPPYHEQAQLAAAQQQQQQQQQLAMQQQQQRQQGQQQIPMQQQQRPAWNAPGSSVMAAAYPGSSSNSASSPSSGPQLRQQPDPAGLRPWHDKGRGPARLAECRAGDAVGLAWAYVHSFCSNQMLLQELAGVLTHRAGQLHAADVSRLLWAYATAQVRARTLRRATQQARADSKGVSQLLLAAQKPG
jgi:hypothetical protein